MIRLLRGLLSAMALLALCLGAPALLWRWGTLDFHILLSFGAPDDGTLLLSLVTLAGWVAWGLTFVEVATDLAAGLSGGRFRWRPATGAWIRPVTTVLVTAVLALALPRVGAPVTQAAVSQAVGVHTAVVQADGDGRVTGTSVPDETVVHVVKPGEDLWGITAQVLGDGSQWRRIAELNPGVADGPVPPGTELRVPVPLLAEAPLDSGPSAPTDVLMVTVKDGDTLWALAEEFLGDGERWPDIAAVNPGLSDPDQIEVGWVLRVPAPRVAPSSGTADTVPVTKPQRDEGRALQELPPGIDAPESRSGDEAAPPSLSTPDARPEHSPTSSDSGLLTDDPVRLVAGSITAALAMGIVGGLAARRRQQLAARPLGARVLHPTPDSTRFVTALGRLASSAQPLAPSVTSVLVGEDAEGRSVLVDLGAHTLTAVVAEQQVALDMIGGMVTSLVCADWSSDVKVTVVSQRLAWTLAFDHPGLTVVGATDEAVGIWERTCIQRRHQTEGDDDSPPEVFLFCDPLAPGVLRHLVDVATPKMHAVLAQPSALAEETLILTPTLGTLASSGTQFTPQLLGEPARRALVELHEVSSAHGTSPAPWWFHPPRGVDPPVPLIIRDRPQLPAEDQGATVHDTPKLLLLGPVHLVGAQGTMPNRAIKQCIEYCTWIHENPGRTSAHMVSALLVADSTRRSNMSRLRTWLGNDAEGDPYLPEAYTGRISLHPAVTSDWEMFRLKLAGGVNRAPSQALVDALTLVRGAPLADAAPGQWHWAEELRSDMISTIRDAAVVLGRRAVEAADLDTARWAVHRALQAAPDDELLMGIKIRAEHIAGNRPEVERMVLQVTRHARLVGSDLLEETVLLLQEVMEGRPRSRRA